MAKFSFSVCRSRWRRTMLMKFDVSFDRPTWTRTSLLDSARSLALLQPPIWIIFKIAHNWMTQERRHLTTLITQSSIPLLTIKSLDYGQQLFSTFKIVPTILCFISDFVAWAIDYAKVEWNSDRDFAKTYRWFTRALLQQKCYWNVWYLGTVLPRKRFNSQPLDSEIFL